jgi:hypothetical protein
VRGLFTRGNEAGKDVNRKGVEEGDDVPWMPISFMALKEEFTVVPV